MCIYPSKLYLPLSCEGHQQTNLDVENSEFKHSTINENSIKNFAFARQWTVEHTEIYFKLNLGCSLVRRKLDFIFYAFENFKFHKHTKKSTQIQSFDLVQF